MARPLGVALFGCGTVGAAVARLLLTHSDRLAARAGRHLQLRHVVVRDAGKPRGIEVPERLVTTDVRTALADSDVDVVVELVGGMDWARSAVLSSLAAGKHVVTANKAVLAWHGDEVFHAAHTARRTVAFEASVAGGVPVVAMLTHGLAANQVIALQGILNGTSNFVLSAMAEGGLNYVAALAEAQARGYAEADPRLDVDGSDAAHKLVILTRLIFGLSLTPESVEQRGIEDVSPADVSLCSKLGYEIKPLVEARFSSDGLVSLYVGPALVRQGTPLARVRGADNAVRVLGDVVGEVIVSGPGAGGMPTASAVVADLIDLAMGRSQLTFAGLHLWETPPGAAQVRPGEDVERPYYLRFVVDDHPGVLAEVAALLAMESISIASVMQNEAPAGDPMPLVLIVQDTPFSRLRAALERIGQSARVREPAVVLPVARSL
jgi:homoserine dehydrogenase